MKNNNTIERKRDRMEVAYMYRDEVEMYFRKGNKWMQNVDMNYFVDAFVKTQIQYSPTTNNGDIITALFKSLTKITPMPQSYIYKF